MRYQLLDAYELLRLEVELHVSRMPTSVDVFKTLTSGNGRGDLALGSP